MFETRHLTEETANNFPKIVVAVELQPDQGLSLARTEIELEGQYAVWGDPQNLLDAAVDGSVSRLDG